MLTPYLHILLANTPLTATQAEAAMTIILEETDLHQTAAFLAILKYRGETSEEIAGMVKAIEKKAVPVSLPFSTLDIVGTGGDLTHTVNISTGSAILAAACGIPVAKHGNRSVSSRSGSADVLEALGVDIDIPPERLSECLQEVNIAFMFAQAYHPSLKKVSPIRKGLKFPTIFNILGPLLNPAKAEYALIGVADPSFLEVVAKVILKFGKKKRALVFHGSGLDELTPLGKITAYDIHDGQMTLLEIDPCSLGFSQCSLQDLQGGDAELNASILQDVFAGKECAIADALIFNAGAALWIFNKASSLIEGIRIARNTLKEGKALAVLNKWRAFSKKIKISNKSNYLDHIIKRKREEVELLIASTRNNPHHPLNEILKQNREPSKRFANALRGSGLTVIAEVKRRSPSIGAIRTIVDPVELALEYCKGGASAISVLTDSEGFGGSLNDLQQISTELAKRYPCVPTLRKDFIVHPLQLAEAVLAGASAILLIASVLGKDLKIFIDEATRLGLETLVEVHNLDELQIALQADSPIIGINHRDLTTFKIDLDLSKTLRPLIPPHIITVAESGIREAFQAKQMHNLGYDSVLVGEALVRSQNPSSLISLMKGGRNES